MEQNEALRTHRKKHTLSIQKVPIMRISKDFLNLCGPEPKKIVYFILGSKAFKYPGGQSRILYIGESADQPLKRPFDSLKERAIEFLNIHGMKTLELVYVQTPPRQRVRMSKRLQDALLYEFRGMYHVLPRGNRQGGARQKYPWPAERLREIIERFENANSVGNREIIG